MNDSVDQRADNRRRSRQCHDIATVTEGLVRVPDIAQNPATNKRLLALGKAKGFTVPKQIGAVPGRDRNDLAITWLNIVCPLDNAGHRVSLVYHRIRG